MVIKLLTCMKRYFWIVALLLLLQSTLNGQQLSDSLSAFVGTLLPSQEVEDYMVLAWASRADYPDSSLIYLKKAHEIIQQKPEYQAQYLGKLYNFIGVAYWYKGNFFEAMEQHKKALAEAEERKDTLQVAHAYHNIGRIHQTQTNFTTAYTYFFQALRLFGAIQDTVGMGYCYQSISTAYQSQGKYVKAIEMVEKSLALRRATKDVRTISSALIELAHIYQHTKNYAKAIAALMKAEKITQNLKEKARIGEINLEIAETHYLQKDYRTALDYAQKAYTTLDTSTNLPLRLRTTLLVGKLNYQIGQYSQAINFLNFVLSPANKTGDLGIRSDALYYLSMIKEKQHQPEEALQYFKAYNLVEDSILDLEKSKAIGRLESKFELLKKEQENNYLKERQKNSQRIIQQTEQRNLALVVIVILGAGLMAILVWKNQQTARLFELLKKQKEETELQYQEVKRSKEKLEDLNKEKDGLMGIVAHDLKAPLNRIKGYVQIIKLTAQLGQEQQQYIQGIETSTENGRNLIRDLLDVSAYEQGDLTLHVEAVNVNELMAGIIGAYELEAEKKGLAIQQDFQENIIIQSDTTLLARIVENLYSNAIKFSPHHKQIYTRIWSNESHVSISIRDEGPGFSQEDKQQMFKKFQKLSARPTGGENSTGLGLAIVRNLLDRLQGDVQLLSEEKQGAEFVLSFPYAIEA